MKMKKVVLIMTMGSMLTCGVVPALPALAMEYFDTTDKIGHSDEVFTFGGGDEEPVSTPSEATPSEPEKPEPEPTPSEATPTEPEKPEPEPSEATPSEPEEATPSEATPSNSSGGNGGGGSRSSGGSSNHGNKSSSSDDTNVIKQESDTDDKVRVMQTVEHNDDQALPITGDGNVGVWGIVSLISGFGALFLECKKRVKNLIRENV